MSAERPQSLCYSLQTTVNGVVPKDLVESLTTRGKLHALYEGIGSVGMCNACQHFLALEPNGRFPGVAGCTEGFTPASPVSLNS